MSNHHFDFGDLPPLLPFPFPLPFFFFFGFLFFMIYAWSSFTGWEMVSGSSKRKTTLFSLTSFKSFLAIPSGIQLFLKLYFAIDGFFLTIYIISFSIFSSIESPMSSLYPSIFIWTSAMLNFSKVSPQLLTALKI